MIEQNRTYEQIEEITLHFGKGTVEPFTAKDGQEMTVSNRELKSMVEFYKKDLVPKYDIPEL